MLIHFYVKTVPICMSALASFESGEDVMNSSGGVGNETKHCPVLASLGRQVHSH